MHWHPRALAALGLISLASLILAEDARVLRWPDVKGDQVVFSYAGDLWISKLDGGFARRLTSHPGLENLAKFSPDGKWIAFTGSYDGNADVYVIPAEGGEPRRLTYEPEPDLVRGWTPDGKIAYASTAGSFTNSQARLWLIDPNGGLPQATPVMEVGNLSYSPDGRQLAYNRSNAHQFNWRRYRGGTQGRISIYNFAENSYRELPSQRENSWFPMWVGNDIYYISDRNQGTVNLYRHDLRSNRSEQITRFADADLRWPSTDGKTIVYEHDGYLYAMDIATKQARRVTPQIRSDMLPVQATMRNYSNWLQGLAISPSGARVVVEARGELFSVPARNGETRLLTGTTGVRERYPNWSPDARVIAYLSDESGEFQIYTVPPLGGKPTQVTRDPSLRIESYEWSPNSKMMTLNQVGGKLSLLDMSTGIVKDIATNIAGNQAQPHDWSPDSKWIVYVTTEPNLNSATYLYEVATGKKTKITEGYFSDMSAAFDKGGKYLYLLSARAFNIAPGAFEFGLNFQNAMQFVVIPLTADLPDPLKKPGDEEPDPDKPPAAAEQAKEVDVKIDFNGLAERAILLPIPAGQYGGPIGLRNGFLYFSNTGAVMRYDLGAQPQQVIAGVQMLSLNPAGTKFAYLAGGVIGVSDVRPGVNVGDGRVDLNGLVAMHNPRDEWKQMYWEAWRYMRDRFYDKDMLGLNWKAIGDRYAQYLPYVAHRSDLSYLLGLMVGELGTGHAYVQGGDMGAMPPSVPPAGLGADYRPVGTHLQFAKIYRGLNFDPTRRGPLGAPGVNVKEGDYLLAIDGTPVTSTTNPNALLIGKAGRSVVLTVNDTPSMEGARTVRVEPIASESQLRYIEWVEANRKYVEEKSGGKIGYMHVPNTSIQGFVEFSKGYYGQGDKQALIVDERFNGGGMIPTDMIERLMRRDMAGIRQRYGEDIMFPTQAPRGPMAMLVNEYAGSGGDLFPYFFKKMGLGPLIGTRTWGGLVGISGSAPLVDGGGITAPEFGLYDPVTGEWIAENTGIDPDIVVDARPDLVARGQDPQLDKAIEYLMKELEKPQPQIKRPNFPRVGGGGG